MVEKVYNYLLEAAGSYYDWGTKSYVSYYYEYVKGNQPSFGLKQPTYREIAQALNIKQSQVRECIYKLEKDGRAKKPKWKYKVGTVKYRDENGYIKTLSAYAGGDCFLVLLFEYGCKCDIIEVFDTKDRFRKCYDTWIMDSSGKPWMVRDKALYGIEDWLEWEININDSAWPGAVFLIIFMASPTTKT